MNSVLEMPARCAACKENKSDYSPVRPSLCVACAEAADTAEIVSATAGDMTNAQFDLVAAALNHLKTDADAFAILRKYAALLNGDVAVALFLEPESGWEVCIRPDGM